MAAENKKLQKEGNKNMKLKEIFKIENILSGRKTPCDIEKFLDEEYFTESGNTFIKYGDLDLTHFIRANLKEFRNLDLNNEVLNKIKELKSIVVNNQQQ